MLINDDNELVDLKEEVTDTKAVEEVGVYDIYAPLKDFDRPYEKTLLCRVQGKISDVQRYAETVKGFKRNGSEGRIYKVREGNIEIINVSGYLAEVEELNKMVKDRENLDKAIEKKGKEINEKYSYL